LSGDPAELGNRGHTAGELNRGGHHIGFDASKALGAVRYSSFFAFPVKQGSYREDLRSRV